MDAPPAKEDIRPFLRIARILRQGGVRVPEIFAHDEQQGFMLLEDLGDQSWAQTLRLDLAPMDSLLEDALGQLRRLQAIDPSQHAPWMYFDSARIRRECALWTDWFLPNIAQRKPTPEQREQLLDDLERLFAPLRGIPMAIVHLDFHSRNLMLPEGKTPLAVIDFQDALLGPITYDLASLLYDCYQDYPEPMRRDWSRRFFLSMEHQYRDAFLSFEQWHELLRRTAMQRHLKAIGIFARLAMRDGKRNFLREIPLTLRHLCEECAHFARETNALTRAMLDHSVAAARMVKRDLQNGEK